MRIYGSAEGVNKLLRIRRRLIILKHEVKAALKVGIKTIDTQRLNERLQHIAKLPRPGYKGSRCAPERCRCNHGIIE